MAALGTLRFSVKQNEAFYLTSLERSGSQLVVDAPVPVRDGDRVRMLGYQGAGLKWTKQGGKLVMDVPEAVRDSGSRSWVFTMDRHSRIGWGFKSSRT